MQLTIKKLVLQQLIEKAGAVVSGSCREILPVLKNFHFEATQSNGHGMLRVVATDLDLAVIAWTEMVVVSEPGTSIVPARKLMEMAKEAGDVDVVMQTNGEIASIITPHTAWSIQLMKEKYPPIPEIGNVQWFEIKSEIFASGLKKVRNAISSDQDKRPELTLVKCGNDGIFATDGARLHHAKVPLPVEIEIQASAVDDLVRMLRSFPDMVIKIAQTDTHILFEIANHVFMCTKLQVQFPSVQHIITSRSGNTVELQVSRADLITAIKQTRITADEETNRITLTIENHVLLAETRDKLGAYCKAAMAVHWPYTKFQIATNYHYIEQAVTDMDSPNVRILFGQDRGKQKAPIVIEEENFYAVISQLRVEGATS